MMSALRTIRDILVMIWLLFPSTYSLLRFPLHVCRSFDLRMQGDDNIHKRWTLEDDKLLDQMVNSDSPIEEMCTILRRSESGVKNRIRNIRNVKHSAYHRLFGNMEIQRQKVKANRKIFVDLDGVLVDFDYGVKRILNKEPDEISPRLMWSRIASTGDFFTHLPWMDGGKLLWTSIVKAGYDPVILTGCPRGEYAPKQKKQWCDRELGIEVEVITTYSKLKHTFCTPGSILIDDNALLGPAWIEAGGMFVLHKNTESTLRILKEMNVL